VTEIRRSAVRDLGEQARAGAGGARSAPADAQEAVKAHAVEALDGYRASLDDHLAKRGPYLLGERFTGADLFLFMLTRRGRRLEHRWWDAPTLGAHYHTIKERPAIQRVFEQEGLDDAS
jgi:glutathione S-transferase